MARTACKAGPRQGQARRAGGGYQQDRQSRRIDADRRPRLLHEHAGQPVALIIDEAQHAITSEAGETAMTALKSAQDQLQPARSGQLDAGDVGLRPRQAAALGQHSGRAVLWFRYSACRLWGRTSSPMWQHSLKLSGPNSPADQAQLQQAFDVFGHRPQFFMHRIGQWVIQPLAALTGRFRTRFCWRLQQQQAQDEAQMESDYWALKPTNSAVAHVEQGPRFRPTTPRPCALPRQNQPPCEQRPSAARALRAFTPQRMPALVWKSARRIRRGRRRHAPLV